jgi:hypothetical protein
MKDQAEYGNYVYEGRATNDNVDLKARYANYLANDIYERMAANDSVGNINALSLHIPTALHQAYQNKILRQREIMCFTVFAEAADEEKKLLPVFAAFTDLVHSKMRARGLQMNKEQFAANAFADMEDMMAHAFRWAQRWLAEFRDDPNDDFMTVNFANHCIRLLVAYKRGIKDTPMYAGFFD